MSDSDLDSIFNEDSDNEQFDYDDGGSNSDSDYAKQVPSSVEKPIGKERTNQTSRHLQQLCDTLQLNQFKDKVTLKREKRKRQKERRRQKKIEQSSKILPVKEGPQIQTLATMQPNSKASKCQPEVITYKDPGKRKKDKNVNKNEVLQKKVKLDDNINDDQDEVTMKQARFDVFKFGIRGLDKEGQHEARVALALRLGAKPPKRKGLPYAQYKEEEKLRKEEILKQKELDKMTGMKKVSARPLSTKKSKKSNNTFKDDSTNSSNAKHKKTQHEKTPLKMGKFDGGTLRISKKELANMKNKK